MFARTERLLLRPAWAEDAPALATAIADYAIVSKLARAPWPYGREDAEAFVSAERGPLPNFLIFARTGASPRLIGGIALDSIDEGVELGYWIARPYWGLGFATEAARAVVDIADTTLRLPQLVAGHFADNPASGNVLRKLGFAPTGRTVTRACRARASVEPCIEYRRKAGSRGNPPEIERMYDREDAMAA